MTESRWWDRIPAVRFWRRFTAAGPSVLAAAVAYNLFFAFVPGIAALLAAASVFGRDEVAIEQTRNVLDRIAPPSVSEFVAGSLLPDVAETVRESQGFLFPVSALVSLFLATRAVGTLQRVLARIEEMEDHRPWWQTRLLSVLLTVGALIALVSSAVLIVAGDAITSWLIDLSAASWVVRIWESLALPLASVGVLLFLVALYRYGPPERLPGLWLASVLSTVGAIGASLLFRLFLDRVGATGGTMAVFGVFAVLLLWLYLIAYVIIIAAAFAASLARRRQRRRGERLDPPTEEISLGLDTMEKELAAD